MEKAAIKKELKRKERQAAKKKQSPVSYDYSGAGYWIAQNSKILFAYVGFQSLLLIIYEAVFNQPLQIERLMILGVPILIMLAMRNLANDSAKPGLVAIYHSWTTILLAATGVAMGYLYKSEFHISVLLMSIGALIIMAGLSCYFWTWYLVNLLWLTVLMVWTIYPWFQIQENRPVLFQTTAIVFISAVFCRARVKEFKDQVNQTSAWTDHRIKLQAAVNSANENKNRFEKIYEGSFEGIVLHKAGYITDCNPALLEIFQIPKEEIVNQNILKLLRQEGNTELMNSILIGESQSREIRTVNKYGETLYLEILSKFLESDNGDTVATALRNVTQRKIAEEEIRAKNAALEKQFDRQKALADWSAVLDRKQDLQEMSGMILRYLSDLLPARGGVYFGLRSSRNASWHVFVARNGKVEPEIWTSDKSRPLRVLADEVCRERLTLTRVPESLGVQKRAFAALPLDLSAGREGFIMVQDLELDGYTHQDLDFLVTVATRFSLGLENKKMVEDLVDARDAAEAGSRAKSQFLDTLSHELRTPLNGIIGSCQILDAFMTNIEESTTLQTIRDSSESMINMVDRILSFTQVEGGRLKFKSANFSISTLIAEVADSLESMRQSRRLALNFHHPAEPLEEWISDFQSCKTILLNLVENGLKFTNVGRVDVSYQRLVRQGKPFLHFEVHDTGIGYPIEKEAEMFKPFTQVESHHSRQYGGLGLGLAVCKALAGSLGGAIGARKSETGSLFWFEIPEGIDSFSSSSAETQAPEKLNPTAQASTPPPATPAPIDSHNSGIPKDTDHDEMASSVAGSKILILETSPVIRMALMRHYDKLDTEADFCKDFDELTRKYHQSVNQNIPYREILISDKFDLESVHQVMIRLSQLSSAAMPQFKRMSRPRDKSSTGLKLEKIALPTAHT